VVLVDVIVGVEGHVSISVVCHHNFISDIHDISTVPGTFTWDNVEWTLTVDISVIWAVSISPFVFDLDDTFVDFTSIDGSIVVEVTFLEE